MSATTQKIRQKTSTIQNDYFPQRFVTQQVIDNLTHFIIDCLKGSVPLCTALQELSDEVLVSYKRYQYCFSMEKQNIL